jgi:biotin operon repressor
VSILLFISALQTIPINITPETQGVTELAHNSGVLVSNFQSSSIHDLSSYIPTIIVGKLSLGRYQKWQNNQQEPHINRLLLSQIISRNPGISLRAIQRQAGLAMGVIQYHMRYLEDSEIESFKQGRSKHFFNINGHYSYEEKLWLSLTRNPNIKMILTSLGSENNAISQKDLVERTGNSRALISYYIKILRQQGILDDNVGNQKIQINSKYQSLSTRTYWENRQIDKIS